MHICCRLVHLENTHMPKNVPWYEYVQSQRRQCKPWKFLKHNFKDTVKKLILCIREGVWRNMIDIRVKEFENKRVFSLSWNMEVVNAPPVWCSKVSLSYDEWTIWYQATLYIVTKCIGQPVLTHECKNILIIRSLGSLACNECWMACK